MSKLFISGGPSYLASVPHGRRLLVVGAVSRLGMGMTPLALILSVIKAGNGFGAAGVATGVYGLAGAGAGPLVGRLMDRLGPSLLLRIMGPLNLGLTSGIWLASRSGLACTYVACGLAGATYPPLTAALRGSWASLSGDERSAAALARLRASALALDAVTFELVFLLGPALVAAIVSFAPPGGALLLIAFVTGGGSLLVAVNPLLSSRPPRPRHRTRPPGALRISGFVPLVATSGALGITFGAVTVAVTAFADRVSGNSATAGFLLALWGLGSIIGGGLLARHPPRRALQPVLMILLSLIAVSTLLLAATSGVMTMGVVLGLGGLAVAPAVAAYTTLANSIVPADVRGEANTWLVAVPAAAQAVGSWIAGWLVARFHDSQVAFLVAGAVTAASLVWLRRPRRTVNGGM
ncbi:MFS transporter [Kribbella sp. NBC_00482]|uniref:MFS transporter n=1 Tax=Kribbella sp. NBC_00482 TaxID=2975968 RepID=UPI002E181476